MASGRKFHVLVVDDSDGMAELTVQMLERLGYSAQGETKSLTALRTFSDEPHKFDFAIIEPAVSEQRGPVRAVLGKMRRGSPVTPELTGLELATRFRRIKPGFPVMFCTGYIATSLAEEIKDAGFGEIIFKPLGLKELGEAIKDGLSSYLLNIR